MSSIAFCIFSSTDLEILWVFRERIFPFSIVSLIWSAISLVSKFLYPAFAFTISGFSQKKNLFFLLVYFFSTEVQTELWAQNLTISGVRIWISSKQTFSPPKDLRIQKGILVSVRDSATKLEKSFFALPGFCDAYTTLGVNPWGGEANPESVKMALLGFLSAGFTQIESVGDGKWVQRVQGYISRNDWKGPLILQSVPPVVPDSGFPISPDLYFTARSDEEIQKYLLDRRAGRVHIFHRKIGSYIPDLRFLYKLRVNLPSEGRWILHTFADPISGREALATGWDTIFHPIAFDAPRFQMENILWAPLMGIYYYQAKRSKRDWEEERAEGIEMSPFFQLTYGEISQSLGEPLPEDSLALAKALYKEYESQFLSRSYMSGRLIFASGTGHPLVYPGLGGIRESEIWENAMAHWEREISEENPEISRTENFGGFEQFLRWIVFREERVLQRVSTEPSKVPKYRLDLLKALTEDTCAFLSVPYRGRIQEGEESHLLLYDRNPLEKKGGIHNPVSVYVRGNHVYGKKL